MLKAFGAREVKAIRGTKMVPGKAWKLITPGGRAFRATLVRRLKIGSESVAVFRVLRQKA
jgi:hypothetical protein